MFAPTFKAKLFACTAAYLVPEWYKRGFEKPRLQFALR